MPKPTAVYIDGYNLYYGRIRGTSYKWLDVVSLFDRLLREQDPANSVDLVRYFSAYCLAKFATHGQASAIAQQSFLRAHESLHLARFAKTMGTHSYDRDGTLIPQFIPGTPYDREVRAHVWKLEEKQTDVNLALAMYRDACSGKFEQLVVCSNDSDVEPVLQAIRSDFPRIELGVVTPRPAPEAGVPAYRNELSSLSRHVDWTRSHIHDAELAACQLPQRVPTKKKAIDKPAHW